MITAGIDIGSATSKAVIMDDQELVGFVILPTGTEWEKVTKLAMEKALIKANLGLEDINNTVSTGYGRRTVEFADKTISEITAHARGVRWLHDATRSIIDIGGQDSKAILLDDDGLVVNFAMNDRCAAGTGRFLEHIASVLQVRLEDMGSLSLSSKNTATISSMCTVFAETEVVSLLAQGWRRDDIIAGVHRSIAKRTVAMAKQVGVREDVGFSGGVAKNIGVQRAMEDLLGMDVYVPPEPQITAAIGAALIAQGIKRTK